MSIKKSKTKKNIKKKVVQKTIPEMQMKIDREKHFALWAGVVFFMTIIVFFWIFSFKHGVIANSVEKKEGQSLTEVLDKFNSTFDDVADNVKNLKDGIGETDKTDTDKEQIEVLQKRLTEIEERIELEKFLSEFNNELQQEIANE